MVISRGPSKEKGYTMEEAQNIAIDEVRQGYYQEAVSLNLQFFLQGNNHPKKNDSAFVQKCFEFLICNTEIKLSFNFIDTRAEMMNSESPEHEKVARLFDSISRFLMHNVIEREMKLFLRQPSNLSSQEIAEDRNKEIEQNQQSERINWKEKRRLWKAQREAKKLQLLNEGLSAVDTKASFVENSGIEKKESFAAKFKRPSTPTDSERTAATSYSEVGDDQATPPISPSNKYSLPQNDNTETRKAHHRPLTTKPNRFLDAPIRPSPYFAVNEVMVGGREKMILCIPKTSILTQEMGMKIRHNLNEKSVSPINGDGHVLKCGDFGYLVKVGGQSWVLAARQYSEEIGKEILLCVNHIYTQKHQSHSPKHLVEVSELINKSDAEFEEAKKDTALLMYIKAMDNQKSTGRER